MELLDRIKVSSDVKDIKKEDIDELCRQIRTFLVEVVTGNGGHLASNLGVVELTVALHRCLDMEKDHIIFDVGHQSYVHKILTGRKDSLATMGSIDGLGCFPDEEESRYDSFNTGHASTSVSAALGMEKALRMSGSDSKVVAVLGDGALGGGMVYEALNNAKDLDSDILIILNDNEMSISRNVGAMSRHLSKLKLRPSYIETNVRIKRIVEKTPGGKGFIRLIQKTKRALKSFVGQKMFFEDLDIRYLGPVDGHDEHQLESIIKEALNVKGPKLLHVVTTKGKGYEKAERDPVKFHGLKNSYSKSRRLPENIMYNQLFGKLLTEMAEKDKNIVCVCPAMTEGSGLSEFCKVHKDRYFDVGICEQHAVTFSAGLARDGIKPVCVVYSSFLQRAYDQILHDIGLTNKNVVLCVDRAGVVDAYGKTHQGIYDIAYLSTIPNMRIFAPESEEDMEKLLHKAIYDIEGCVAVRYPYDQIHGNIKKLFINVSEKSGISLYSKNGDKAILCYGRMVAVAVEAADIAGADVVKLTDIYPLDYESLYEVLGKYKYVVSAEDVIYNGSVGQRLQSWLYENNKNDFKLICLNIRENCEMKGCVEDILEENGMSKDAIARIINEQNNKDN
ncbi:MAG TPA: 1-deoxy-D-xylulose-5-phosphate synthase [Clostridia bacterium]|nr:1-deoxy-D-xylulose-5-phosphate synthase [Clostridia bacterium]